MPIDDHSMRGVRRGVALAVITVVSLLGVTAAAMSAFDEPADLPDVPATRVDPPTPALVIGDSAISHIRWVPNAASAVAGFDRLLDLESCRRLIDASCSGREGRRPPTAYEALQAHGDNYTTLVVATGYNDRSDRFADAFRAIVSRARSLGYDRVVWYTLRSDVGYVSPDQRSNHETFAANNQTLRELVATGRYPEVVIADWDGYTADRHAWFYSDGVHHTTVGAWAAADYLSRKMAFLEERPCPVPTAPSTPRQDPCPDPDATGPVADIEALYPIGEEGVLCYEVGPDRRLVCGEA